MKKEQINTMHPDDFRIGLLSAEGNVLPALEEEFTEDDFASEEILDPASAGIHVITEKQLQAQQKRAKAAASIPVKKVVVFTAFAKTGQNCKNGDIDNCQNYAWCAKCICPSRIETSADAIFQPSGYQEILDVAAYKKQVK